VSERMWLYTRDGAELGPVSHAALCELFAGAALPLDTLVWHEGLTGSVPASQVEDFRCIWGKGFVKPSGTPPPLPASPPALNESLREIDRDNDRPPVPPARPWVRWWARGFDGGLVASAITVLFGSNPLIVLPATYLAARIVYPLQLSLFGTTLGKWLLGTRVEREEGGRPTFGQAFRREWLCLLKGEALCVPIINLYTAVAAFSGLVHLGTTAWDEATHLVVRHRRVGFFRWVGYFAAWSAIGIASNASLMVLHPHDPQSQQMRAGLAAIGVGSPSVGTPTLSITQSDGTPVQPATQPVAVVRKGRPRVLTLPSNQTAGKNAIQITAPSTRPARRLDRPPPSVTFKAEPVAESN